MTDAQDLPPVLAAEDRPALKACPFCESTDLHFIASRPGSAYGYIYCDTCCAQGPICTDEDAASADWNRRAPTAEGERLYWIGVRNGKLFPATASQDREVCLARCREVLYGTPTPTLFSLTEQQP